MVEIKKCVLMAGRVGEVFDGTITGVARHGLYVTLDGAFVEGLVHGWALGGGLRFDEERLVLAAHRSGLRFRLGDRLRVRLVASDPAQGRIDLACPPGAGDGERVQRASRRRSISPSSL